MTAETLYLLLVSICLLMVFGVWLVLIAIRVVTDLRRVVGYLRRLHRQAKARRRRNAYLDAYFRAHERPLR